MLTSVETFTTHLNEVTTLREEKLRKKKEEEENRKKQQEKRHIEEEYKKYLALKEKFKDIENNVLL